jgi:UDP-N-acetylglucosamine:LPS N-acetylglucosamine transferase
MKILIASTPTTGHLNPLLAIARVLIAERHEITFPDRDRTARPGRKQRSEIPSATPGSGF